VKKALDENNIEMHVPRRIVYQGGEHKPLSDEKS
jgi:hypothetical protein